MSPSAQAVAERAEYERFLREGSERQQASLDEEIVKLLDAVDSGDLGRARVAATMVRFWRDAIARQKSYSR